MTWKFNLIYELKLESHPPQNVIFASWRPFRNDEKWFFFHYKSFFHSQDKGSTIRGRSIMTSSPALPPRHHHASSWMVTRHPLTYVTPVTNPPSPCIIYLSFLIKKQRYAPTHGTFTHVFKQLSQIVRFK